ncbi:putative ribulose-phosphate 3-epimerase domain protein [Clostridioides difficile CD104]|nr:putative ribulose-phosphate 3-epimerase domain protein [Clostridioides difficile CD104]
MNGKKVDIYVVGTSALFNDKPPISYKDKIEELKESIK